MGEPAGIGGELTLHAWLRRDRGAPPFVALDDPDRLQVLAAELELSVPVTAVPDAEAAVRCFPDALPVLPHPLPHPARAGRPAAATAEAVLSSIRSAVSMTVAGETAGIVTNPIQKKPLYDAGFRHAGHTDFLAALAGLPVSDAIMMLVVPGLRAVPVTVHVPLAEVPQLLTEAAILHHARQVAAALRTDFGIARPRIAVAGLNPHAGEDGALGREETVLIAPAVAQLRAEGVDVFGPLSADTLFHPAARAGYDAVLCMYHDQALIPVKTLDFDHGVNVTLGLPFVRTSPDHGTALDIAGTGTARPDSFLAALTLAAELGARRAAAADR